MTNSKTTKKALLSSALALTMCVAMLIATTFAWFTDTASTSVNKIQAGTLDVDLEMKNPAYNVNEENSKEWISAEGETLKFRNASNSDKILWEPGATFNLDSFRIVNNGNLALKYKVIISGLVGSAKLLEAIDFKVEVDGTALAAKDGTTSVPTTVKALNNFEGKLGAEANTGAITISGTMDKNAGNEYQGLSINNIAITVIATQDTAEFDSTTDQYDYSALYPVYEVATVETTTDEDGALKVATNVTIESAQKITPTEGTSEVPVATVKVPADVALEAGTDKLTFDIHETTAANNVEITSAQSKKTLEITVKGVASTNTEPLTITHYIEPGLTGLALKHYTGGEWKSMASVDSETAVNGNQTYYYDKGTGKLVLMSATFSPFTYVYDAPGTQTVTTADELAAALENKDIDTIKLGGDITLSNVATVDHDVTIDFNSKTVTATKAISVSSGKLTFKDSSESKGALTSSERVVDLVGNNTAFELNDITITNTGNNETISFEQYRKVNNSAIVMNSGKIVAKKAIRSGNDFGGKGHTVTINGGKIECEEGYSGIFLDNNCTMTINECEYTVKKSRPFFVDCKSNFSEGNVESSLIINGITFVGTGTKIGTGNPDIEYVIYRSSGATGENVVINQGTFTVDDVETKYTTTTYPFKSE